MRDRQQGRRLHLSAVGNATADGQGVRRLGRGRMEMRRRIVLGLVSAGVLALPGPALAGGNVIVNDHSFQNGTQTNNTTNNTTNNIDNSVDNSVTTIDNSVDNSTTTIDNSVTNVTNTTNIDNSTDVDCSTTGNNADCNIDIDTSGP
jgi:hypothetical protein